MDKDDEFIDSLYDEADKQLNETYKKKKESRDELLKAIAMILLTYTIVDNVLSLSEKDYNKEYSLLGTLIIKLTRGNIKQETSNTTSILKNTIKNTYNHYSYNHNLKDVEKIINDNFKGKHFSDRVWENEQEVAKKLNKQCQDFLRGKINVNQIQSEIKKTYNTSAYNAKRLAETEVSRCHSAAFDRFCKETGVKKVKYVARRCNTCARCLSYDGKIFDIDDKPDIPQHPLCQCYYKIVDGFDGYKMSSNLSNGEPSEGDLISTEEFERFQNLISELGMRAEGFEKYKGDIEVLNELLEDLRIIKETQPIIANMKNGLLIKYDDFGNNEDFAITHKKSISLNSRVFNDTNYMKRLYKECEKDGFFVKGTNYRSVIYHEVGHMICGKNLRLQSELEDYIKNRAFIAGLSVDDYISKNISKYATNRDFRSEMYTELLPEIMAMCYNNGNNKEIGIEILEFLGLR